MSHKALIGRILLALSIATLLPLAAAAEDTGAARISIVSESSDSVVPDIAVEVSERVPIENVRAATSTERTRAGMAPVATLESIADD